MQLLLHIGCVQGLRASLLWAVRDFFDVLHV